MVASCLGESSSLSILFFILFCFLPADLPRPRSTPGAGDGEGHGHRRVDPLPHVCSTPVPRKGICVVPGLLFAPRPSPSPVPARGRGPPRDGEEGAARRGRPAREGPCHSTLALRSRRDGRLPPTVGTRRAPAEGGPLAERLSPAEGRREVWMLRI